MNPVRMNPFEPSVEDLPREIAIFPLKGVLLLPQGKLPLNVFEPRYINLVRDALSGTRMIGMVQLSAAQLGEMESAGDDAPIFDVGCAGRVIGFQETDDGRFLITLKGVCHYRIEQELALVDGYRRVRPDFAPYTADLHADADAVVDRPRLLAALRFYLQHHGINADWDTIDEAPADRLVTTLAMVCPFAADEKQALLESQDATSRAKLMIGLLEIVAAGDGATARH